jgi:hypothetical protein
MDQSAKESASESVCGVLGRRRGRHGYITLGRGVDIVQELANWGNRLALIHGRIDRTLPFLCLWLATGQ